MSGSERTSRTDEIVVVHWSCSCVGESIDQNILPSLYMENGHILLDANYPSKSIKL
jgi:hypothetical protein